MVIKWLKEIHIFNIIMKSQVEKLSIENDKKEKIIHDRFLKRNLELKQKYELDIIENRKQYKLERDMLRTELNKKVKHVKSGYHGRVECVCGETVKRLNIEKHNNSKLHVQFLLNAYMKKINQIKLDEAIHDEEIDNMNNKFHEVIEKMKNI